MSTWYYTPITPATALDHLLGAAHRSSDGVMRLRPSSFVRILAVVPEHVRYERCYRTGKMYPTFHDGAGALRIELSGEPAGAA
jgi:hypothetical protein